MQKSNLDNVRLLKDLPNFPFSTFNELLEAEKKNELAIGTAMDTARKWASQGSTAPESTRKIMRLLAIFSLMLPIAVIVFAIINSDYLKTLFALPMIVFLMMLSPASLRLSNFFKLIVVLGILLLLWRFLGNSSLWTLYLGICIVVPWILNLCIYKYSSSVAKREALKSEERFVELFKYHVLAIQFPNSKIIWADQLIN